MLQCSLQATITFFPVAQPAEYSQGLGIVCDRWNNVECYPLTPVDSFIMDNISDLNFRGRKIAQLS